MAGMSDFNPRSRGGSDNSEPDAGEDQHISIHAPAEGATPKVMPCLVNEPISIHAPAEGATSDIHPIPAIITISIHAPAEGATHGRGKGL